MLQYNWISVLQEILPVQLKLHQQFRQGGNRRGFVIRLKYLFLFFLPITAHAGHWENLKTGDQAAQAFLKEMEGKRKEAGKHPFYSGISKEAHLKETELKGRAQHLSRTDLASQMVSQSADARSQIKIDPEKDPLLVGSQKVITNPLKAIGGKGTHAVEAKSEGKNEIVPCEEAGEDSLEACTQDLNIRIVKTKVKKEWYGEFYISKCSVSEKDGHYLPCIGLRHAFFRAQQALNPLLRSRTPINVNAALNITSAFKTCFAELASRRRWSCSQCTTFLPPLPVPVEKIQEITLLTHPHNSKALHLSIAHWHTYNSGRFEYWYKPLIKVEYEEDSYQVFPDEWSSNCSRLEERSDLGLCSYVSKVCTQGPQTRLIEGIPIRRDCWQYTLTYGCSYPSQNDCSPLRARGCGIINSSCKQMIGNKCVIYSHTYECKGASQTTHTITGGDTPFCLDGNCRDQSWEKNDEMMSSLAQLTLLKEMQGKFKDGCIFSGEDNRCSKQPLSFKDCCGSGKGWGTDLGLASCSAKEKLLSKKRKEGLCHYVGTYCSQKLPVVGTCIEKKAVYCCFGSKLLKAFHEQGRLQIRLGWGEPKEPLCRGFTIQEIQRIDFSKLDLREVFEDLMKNFKPGKQQGMKQDAHNRIEKTDFSQVYEDVMHKSQPTQIQNVGERVKERIEIIKKGMGPK